MRTLFGLVLVVLSVNAFSETFDPELARSMPSLGFECSSTERSLYLIHSEQKRSERGLLMKRFNSREKCEQEAYELNSSVPKIADCEGQKHEVNILVCVKNKFYLVKQSTPLSRCRESRHIAQEEDRPLHGRLHRSA
jgi:hypothetical protein